MPRSGTTLVEQIIASHPKVFGCDELNFNVWTIKEAAKGYELAYMIIFLLESNSLFSNLNVNPKITYNFIVSIQDGYLQNPYHNKLHATDVT